MSTIVARLVGKSARYWGLAAPDRGSTHKTAPARCSALALVDLPPTGGASRLCRRLETARCFHRARASSHSSLLQGRSKKKPQSPEPAQPRISRPVITQLALGSCACVVLLAMVYGGAVPWSSTSIKQPGTSPAGEAHTTQLEVHRTVTRGSTGA